MRPVPRVAILLLVLACAGALAWLARDSSREAPARVAFSASGLGERERVLLLLDPPRAVREALGLDWECAAARATAADGATPLGLRVEGDCAMGARLWAAVEPKDGAFRGYLLAPRAGAPAAAPEAFEGSLAGLVAAWSFEEPGGAALDAGGKVDLAPLDGPRACSDCGRRAAGRQGAGVRLDGTDDAFGAAEPTALETLDAFTVSAWARPREDGPFADGGTIVNLEGRWEVSRFRDGSIRYALQTADAAWEWRVSGASMPLGAWTHVALTYAPDAGAARLFVDARLVHETPASGALVDKYPDLRSFRVGGREKVAAHFAGEIDEVRVFGRALAPDEVARLAASATIVDAADPSRLLLQGLAPPGARVEWGAPERGG